MKTIQPGHDIFSLFISAAKIQALAQKIPNYGLVKSLVSAFLIVILAGLILGLAQRALTADTKVNSADTSLDFQEKTAFIPGQFVTGQINQGYLSR